MLSDPSFCGKRSWSGRALCASYVLTHHTLALSSFYEMLPGPWLCGLVQQSMLSIIIFQSLVGQLAYLITDISKEALVALTLCVELIFVPKNHKLLYNNQ